MSRITDLEFQVRSKADQDPDFRAQLIENPRAAIAEATGIPVPEQFTVHIHEESENDIHLVLPPPSRELSDEELKAAAGGFGLLW